MHATNGINQKAIFGLGGVFSINIMFESHLLPTTYPSIDTVDYW